jgi:hypothetical protein
MPRAIRVFFVCVFFVQLPVDACTSTIYFVPKTLVLELNWSGVEYEHPNAHHVAYKTLYQAG